MKHLYAIDHTADFIDYMRDRLDLDLRHQHLDGPHWFCVSVREEESGIILAGLACEFKSRFDAHFSAAIDRPEAISRILLGGIFTALFTQASRVTALVDPENQEAEDRLQRLGFVYEGFLRRGLDGKRDALLYGMLPEDCIYLPGIRAARIKRRDQEWSASPKPQTHTIPRPPNSRLI